MAVLINPHWHCISGHQRGFLQAVGCAPFSSRFNLAGPVGMIHASTGRKQAKEQRERLQHEQPKEQA